MTRVNQTMHGVGMVEDAMSRRKVQRWYNYREYPSQVEACLSWLQSGASCCSYGLVSGSFSCLKKADFARKAARVIFLPVVWLGSRLGESGERQTVRPSRLGVVTGAIGALLVCAGRKRRTRVRMHFP